MKLVICEKPSVAAAVASALGITNKKCGFYEGAGYLVSWCVGHLVGLADAGAYNEAWRKWRYGDLPLLPESLKYSVSPEKKERFKELKALMERPDVTALVNACDAGREGELIFRLACREAGCEKPVFRLWISSMEDASIQEGFQNLKPGDSYENLYQSALCRQAADWIIGINATRLFSVLYHHTLTVGRVQTPTLAMLTEREGKIKAFVKEPFFHVRLALPGCEAISERLTDKHAAETILRACQGSTVTCESVLREEKAEQSPKLFDLTTLQREANRLFGYTAKQTLDYAQNLYEKKLLTYPRTDSRYLTRDMEETASRILRLIIRCPPFDGCPGFPLDVAALISDKDVSDHHAIIPTIEMETADLSALPKGEAQLFSLVLDKTLCAAAQPHVYEAVTAAFSCGGYAFTAKGRHILSGGWKDVHTLFLAYVKQEDTRNTEKEDAGTLPTIESGQAFMDFTASVTEHFTSPPKHFTEDTLLAAMERAGEADMPEDAERKGIGTPATRAGIIEKLVHGGFLERKGKVLIPSQAGHALVSVLPEELTSPLLTAQWERRLSRIAKGMESPEAFLADIRGMAAELVQTCTQARPEKAAAFLPEREPIGICPRCGSPVYEGKKNFYCADRACGFVLWREDRFFTGKKKVLTKQMAAELLKEGRTFVKGLYSEKKGRAYDAAIVLDDPGGKYVNYRLVFDHAKKNTKR